MFMFLGKFSICSLVRMDRPAMFWSVVAFATLLVLKQTVFHVSIKTLHWAHSWGTKQAILTLSQSQCIDWITPVAMRHHMHNLRPGRWWQDCGGLCFLPAFRTLLHWCSRQREHKRYRTSDDLLQPISQSRDAICSSWNVWNEAEAATWCDCEGHSVHHFPNICHHNVKNHHGLFCVQFVLPLQLVDLPGATRGLWVFGL